MFEETETYRESTDEKRDEVDDDDLLKVRDPMSSEFWR
jgi:hypothetical protein